MDKKAVKALKKIVKDWRVSTSQNYSRNNPYGRGMKDGLAICLEAITEIEKGSVYDPVTHAWLSPDAETKRGGM